RPSSSRQSSTVTRRGCTSSASVRARRRSRSPRRSSRPSTRPPVRSAPEKLVEDVRVAFLGPAGTFAEEAPPASAPQGAETAELYGGEVLAESVQDGSDNATRFVWLAPAGVEPEAEATKTSIVFWGFSDESPGALVRVLSELADREVNLTKIESRPRRVRLGHYMFFADLVGGAEEPAVREALGALSERVQTLKVLGSYPV